MKHLTPYLLSFCLTVSLPELLAGPITDASTLPQPTDAHLVSRHTRDAKRVKGYYKGHEFEVVNKWFEGLKLYHDGELVARNNQLLALEPTTPFVSYEFEIDSVTHVVDVYVLAVASVKIKLVVDGEKIAGDDF